MSACCTAARPQVLCAEALNRKLMSTLEQLAAHPPPRVKLPIPTTLPAAAPPLSPKKAHPSHNHPQHQQLRSVGPQGGAGHGGATPARTATPPPLATHPSATHLPTVLEADDELAVNPSRETSTLHLRCSTQTHARALQRVRRKLRVYTCACCMCTCACVSAVCSVVQGAMGDSACAVA